MRDIAPVLALALALLIAAPAAAEDGPAPAPIAAEPTAPDCIAGICQLRVTPEQLLAQAELLVRQRRFADAAPLIDALEQAPAMRLQSRFLAGFVASEQGDYQSAANTFKAILTDDPKQTRVRLELARAMLGMGQTASADRQFRIAERDGDLPPDIARSIRGARAVIRSKRAWRLDVDFGIAPDSNINNATANDSVTVLYGDTVLPVALDGNARARSGTGVTGSVSAGVRLPVSAKGAVLVDFDASGTNYPGSGYDDYLVQAAAGPQLLLSDAASISLEGVAAQRWYGGHSASHQFGGKLGGQLSLGKRTRLGLQLDIRHTTALFDPNYSGWQTGVYLNGERAVATNLVASGGLFVRRDWLKAATYSSAEYGASLGLGGELGYGINFGASGSLSRAVYDAPFPIFSLDPRHDWRLGGRVTLGNRKLRLFGFSPEASVSYARTDSSLPYFATDRLRWRLAVARYF